MTALRAIAPYAIAIVLVALSLFGAYRHGVRVTANEYEGKLASMQLAASEQARAQEQASDARMAAIDAKHTKELKNEKAKHERAIAGLRADAIRVRDRFTCPASGTGQAESATGVGDGRTQRGLSRTDAEFLLREAARADEVVLQLKALQDIVRGDRGEVSTYSQLPE